MVNGPKNQKSAKVSELIFFSNFAAPYKVE
jgi:hypothetical protein